MLETSEHGASLEVLQQKLKKELDALGNEAIRLVIEQADKRLRDNRSERRGWVIAQRDNKKTLLTQFGSVSYRRTNFKHKALRSHRHLVDDQIGVRPHQKVDGSLQAELVERAVSHSYRVSGRWSENASWHVSGQTVMNAIREMDTSAAATQDLGSDKRTVRYIFIQADEDHVPNQDTGGRWEPRLKIGRAAC